MPDPAPSDLTPPPANGPALAAAFAERARAYAALAKAASTRRAYASDMRAFARWCAARGLGALPAEPATVLAYLIDAADRVKVATLRRRLTAIREAHKYAGLPLPLDGAAFRDAWRGLRRAKGAPPAKKAPLLTAELRRALDLLPKERLLGRRDRALLLIGFAAALRRSELVALQVTSEANASWIEQTSEGLVIRLARSKTDSEGRGAAISVHRGRDPASCPVRAYDDWLAASGITEGPAFRPVDRHGRIGAKALSDKAVALIVQRAVERAALADGASVEAACARARRYAGHSLRSGLATSAACHDAPGYLIQRQLRHKKFETTAGYIDAGQLFRHNLAGMAGL